MANVFTERITALRGIMAQNGWDAVVVSGSDPHTSEYPAPRWQQVAWLSGFTGEAGDLVVTMDHAGLWTDTRFFIQALSQLEGSGVELHKLKVPEAVSIPQWLSGKVKTVALDGLCWNVDAVKEISDALGEGGRIVDVPDMLGTLWTDRPQIPVTPITTLDVDTFGGTPRTEKITWLRKWMLLKGLDRVLLTSLDEIAWLLNVRGNDIEYNPLVISYLLVSHDSVRWFVKKQGTCDGADPDTLDSFDELEMDKVAVDDYDAVFYALSDFSGEQSPVTLFVDPSTLNYHIYSYILDSYTPERVVAGTSPVILEKAIKTPSEIENLRQTHIDDGIAVECFHHWLDGEMATGREIDEWEASQKLTWFRSQIPGYRGDSFANISAYGPGAALPHYSTPKVGSTVLRPFGLYLIDSGGQYLTGTTDITRTFPMGECSEQEMEDYTIVLRGMIDLTRAVFPRGTSSGQLDPIARMPLWRHQRNYGHGTGHGVGYYLCVHEGPQDIRYQYRTQPVLPGMVTSNEPALYREGMHGVRHENVILCKEAGINEFGDWLEFETLTCCHIDTSAVIPELLGSDGIEWLNDYNDWVYRTLSPLLPADVAEWLRGKTLPI